MLSSSKAPDRYIATMLLVLVGLFACDATGAGSSAPGPLVSAQDSTLYAVGHGLAGQFNLHPLFTAEELERINQGFNDGVLGSGDFDLANHLDSMNRLIQQRRDERSSRLQAEGDAFVAREGKKEGAVTTASGLVYFEQVPGVGASPSKTESVRVHYEGTFSDGTVFDSSYRSGEPIVFRVDRVIAGWTEGLQMMKVGGKTRFVIPARLAYGEAGHPPGISPNVPLVFVVELLEVIQ